MMAFLRRLGRRLFAFLHPRRVRFVYSGRYLMHVSGIPLDPRRAENILTFLGQEGLLRRGDLRWPRLASLASLRRVHGEGYLDTLSEPGSLLRVVGLRIPDAEEDRFLAVQRAMVGGTMLATRLALATGWPAVNLGGGLHHAHRDSGRGFCAFNDVAAAIAQVREGGFGAPILVIDLDLHDGDGTRSIFAEDETVHTFSIHNQDWDDRPAVAATRLALGDDVEDATCLAALREHLPAVLRQLQPGLVFYLAGCDPAADDGLGNWKITASGMLARDCFVIEEVRKIRGDIPLVITLAGGYGHQAWRYSARFFAWLLTDGREAVEPPSTEDITLARYRYQATFLDPAELTTEPGSGGGKSAGDGWLGDLGLSAEDLLPGFGSGQRESRFLSYYSTHGVELALERYGFLSQLRQLGYPHPTIEFQLDHPAGQTVRIFGDEDREDLLVELRVRRDRRSAPGSELLFVEWLLLQHPRGGFTGGRPRLPGQAHPGLGLLRDVVALLVLICERLDLDGIAFTPSHFHLAAQSERYLRFLRPEDQARFQALVRATRGLRLSVATRAIAEGRVRDRKTGEVVPWKPAPMVVPVDPELKAKLEGEEYRQRVEEDLGHWDLEVVLEGDENPRTVLA